MDVIITPLFIALFAILHVPITMLVGIARVPNQVPFYDDGDFDLRKRQRAHANFTEQVPIALLAMAAAEISGVADMLLLLGGALLVLGRVTHYLVIRTVAWSPLRALSMVMTLGAILLFAGATVWQVALV